MLEKLVGKRYATLELLKNDIEILTDKKIEFIAESQSDRFEDMDFMIDYYFNDDDVDSVYTMFYLLDNGNNYYITEV